MSNKRRHDEEPGRYGDNPRDDDQLLGRLKCPQCDGTGRYKGETCPDCNGTGTFHPPRNTDPD